MKKYKKIFAMSAAAFALLGALTIEDSMAYFTTYVSAEGSQIVSMGSRTEIQEDVTNMTKHIVLENISDAEHQSDCYVRVRVFHGGGITVSYGEPEGNSNWYDGNDGYWYYRPILPTGEKTTQLDVKIDTTGLLEENVPEGEEAAYIKDKFNVIVVQECTPVRYREGGEAYADWTTTYSNYTPVTEGEGDGN